MHRNLALLAIALLPPALGAQQRNGERNDERDSIIVRSEPGDTVFRWTGRVARGDFIEVKGINGDVRAELASGDEIEIVATKRARRSDPDDVELQVLQHDDGITVCAVYPTGRWNENNGPNWCGPGEEGQMNTSNNDVRVHFLVRVPRGVTFVGRTVNGTVIAESLAGDVDAHTVNGRVTVSTSDGDVQAVTINGDVAVRMPRPRWAAPLDIRSLNGTVTVELPADASMRVRAETMNGRISSDYPLEIARRAGRYRATGAVGGGRGELYVVTMNGGIRIQKL